MSFLYINDPKKRDTIVTDYLASVKKEKRRTDVGGSETESKKKEESLQPANSIQGFKFAIQFLPGDIKGLQTKLGYLLAEYQAGNTFATRNQIIAVADELFRRGHLSSERYRNINSIIQHTK